MAKQGILRLYRSYSFKEKDPVIYQIRKLMDDEKLTIKQAATLSFVSTSTIHNWINGDTMRPQSASVEAVGRGMGYSREWVKTRDINYDRELTKAADELLKRKQRKKKKGNGRQ